MKKLIPLIINRAKWARGGHNGDSALLNDEGNMCCLGFACRASGIRAKDLDGTGTPASLALSKEILDRKLGPMLVDSDYVNRVQNSEVTDSAVAVNDDEDISDKMREYRLKPILKKLGFSVKFTGPTRE